MPTDPAPTESPFQNILVAVHGIGKQSRNSTVRTVVSMAAENLSSQQNGAPSFSYPLGYFHSDVTAAVKVTPFDEIPDSLKSLEGIGFAEVFWADIPQEVIKESRTLEETKEWARTVMARARNLYHKCSREEKPRRRIPPDFGLAAEVLEEIIDTVYVLENLSWLTEKAGLMSFDVREVLEEYLGDVQIVTEFSYYRRDIVGRFHRAMEEIHASNSHANIHIIAHSEGTVVSFLGLLHAMSNSRVSPAFGSQAAGIQDNMDEPPQWLKNVRGFMTIGSPIDKHLLLWPKLWDAFHLEGSKKLTEDPDRRGQIKWRNYFDLGDPVGYKLETARAWLKDDHKDELFEFNERDDVGFSRYLLPGKAHNDYWDDPAVFDHFIKEVIEPRTNHDSKVPKSRPIDKLVSVSLPYALSGALLVLATYICLRALITYYSPGSDPLGNYIHFMLTGQTPSQSDSYSSLDVFKECFGWAGLLAGTTIASRLPRLAPNQWITAILAAAGGFLCTKLINGNILHMLIGDSVLQQRPFSFIANMVKLPVLDFFMDHGTSDVRNIKVGLLRIILCLVSTTTISVSYLAGKRSREGDTERQGRERRRRWFRKGARPLIIVGSTMIALLAAWPAAHRGFEVNSKSKESQEMAWTSKLELDQAVSSQLLSRPVWPLVVSWLFFVYLWWLSVLVFDLAYVWHRYVRHGDALKNLRAWSPIGKGSPSNEKSPAP